MDLKRSANSDSYPRQDQQLENISDTGFLRRKSNDKDSKKSLDSPMLEYYSS